MPQDMPPTGGYAPIQYKRNLPARGFKPAYYLAAMLGIVIYGFYQHGKAARELNELGREKMWARIYLTAVMQAETDRDMVRRHLASAQRERELTGSTAGFRPGMGVYHGNRFVRPTYAVTPENPVKD